MRYSTTHTVRASVLAAFLASTALLGACSPTRENTLTQSEQMIILEEIDLGSSLVGYDQPELSYATGPNLIAGDWLAIQCAQAGGYFDGYEWAPVYANVISAHYE